MHFILLTQIVVSMGHQAYHVGMQPVVFEKEQFNIKRLILQMFGFRLTYKKYILEQMQHNSGSTGGKQSAE